MSVPDLPSFLRSINSELKRVRSVIAEAQKNYDECVHKMDVSVDEASNRETLNKMESEITSYKAEQQKLEEQLEKTVEEGIKATAEAEQTRKLQEAEERKRKAPVQSGSDTIKKANTEPPANGQQVLPKNYGILNASTCRLNIVLYKHAIANEGGISGLTHKLASTGMTILNNCSKFLKHRENGEMEYVFFYLEREKYALRERLTNINAMYGWFPMSTQINFINDSLFTIKMSGVKVVDNPLVDMHAKFVDHGIVNITISKVNEVGRSNYYLNFRYWSYPVEMHFNLTFELLPSPSAVREIVYPILTKESLAIIGECFVIGRGINPRASRRDIDTLLTDELKRMNITRREVPFYVHPKTSEGQTISTTIWVATENIRVARALASTHVSLGGKLIRWEVKEF